MKQINFISPISPNQQHQIHKWYINSLIALATLLVSIGLVQIHQFKKLNTIKKQRELLNKDNNEITTFLDHHQSLKNKKEHLENRSKNIAKIIQHRQLPFNYFVALKRALPNAQQIESITLADDSIELVASCNDTQAATKIVSSLLKTAYFQDVKIISLHKHKHDQGLRTTIKGHIV